MADVDGLLRQFIERYESGDPVRPIDVLGQVEGTDRRELEMLLDAYLERAPRRPFSADAFAASPARPLVDDLAQSLEGIAGTWPVVLPRLRARARLRRSELVTRLAAALGVGDREAKVAGYYHAMEQGELDPAGVSDRVLEALARLTGTTAQALRDAATALQPGAGPAAAEPRSSRAPRGLSPSTWPRWAPRPPTRRRSASVGMSSMSFSPAATSGSRWAGRLTPRSPCTARRTPTASWPTPSTRVTPGWPSC